jgi:hypothetical protein
MNSFPYLGKIKPRHARDITGSNWSIGGETMDRGYTEFDQWRAYLGPLGAKQVRLQGGWAKCEPEPGVYRFEWLDTIVDDCLAQGVDPWLQVSYGNPIYPGGGDFYLGGGLPTSESALQAWDRWVRAAAERYKDRVTVWEVWNEPDLDPNNSAEQYASLFVRTAQIIRAAIPQARIYAGSLARIHDPAWIETLLRTLQQQGLLDLVDEITVHGYTRRPEENLNAYGALKKVIAGYDARIILRQGELGCPSEYQPRYALREYPWTETSQAKWLLRRLLSDLGHDIPSLYFAIIDMVYERHHHQAGVRTINRKGLLKANADRSVAAVKPAYYAMQYLTATMDDRLARITDLWSESSAQHSLALYGYRETEGRAHVLSLWFDGEIPGDTNQKTQIDLTVQGCTFEQPAYVDLRSGEVYGIPKAMFQANGSRVTFSDLPVYDSPVLIAERSLLNLPGS